ncbi:uncharacterized protein PRCAT00005013001 [Priceomyces carsonii]|uniref:uncharacterized protein n=1 Tax=Priceomyces carsonii TaxID=28549 RepID=UPI002EDA3C46|nr:unnamed protein product [Priceomyces carsonii]
MTKDDEADQLKKQKRMFSFLLLKKVPPVPLQDERRPFPESRANILSKIFFWWINPILKVGYLRTLEPEDLFLLTEDITVQSMYLKYKGLVAQLQHKFNGKLSITNVYILSIIDTFKLEYGLAFTYLAIASSAASLNPLLSRHLIEFVELRTGGAEKSAGKGVGYAIGTAVMIFITGILQNHSFQKSMTVGAKARAVLIKDIAEKSFRLSESSKHLYPTGKIMSMIGTDISRIDSALGFFNNLATFPITFVIALVILLVNIGVSALVGIALMICFLVFLFICTKKMVKFRRIANIFTDKRIGYIQEVLNNLRMIKYYSWEDPYFNEIETARKKEMHNVLKVQALRNFVMAGALSFSNIVSMVSFLVLYAISDVGNISGIFASLSLFNLLAQQIYILPVVLSASADAYLGIKRISKFLTCEEIEHNDEIPTVVSSKRSSKSSLDMKVAIEIKDGEFMWETYDDTLPENDESNGFTGLHHINFDIRKGEFIVITGPVGCGKTTLLNAFSGYLKSSSGKVRINGSLLFCDQPWIQNATVRENITFGSSFEEEKYRNVIRACCLEEDFKNFAAGDLTEIGERGITLSGGQKARVNLARAAYENRDIILMDDVLSAVDSRVGRIIVQKCILDYLSDKTRVLATHQLSLIGSADRIVFINNDGTLDVGSLQVLKERNKAFSQLMTFNETETTTDTSENIEDIEEENDDEEDDDDEKDDEKATTNELPISNMEDSKNAQLIGKEKRGVNRIPFKVYKNFMKFGSGKLNPMVWILVYLTATLCAVFCQLFSNVWLSFWVDQKFSLRPNSFYIGLYVMFSLLTCVFLVAELLSIVSLNNKAALKFHLMGIRRVLHTPMLYIDTTPIGRILNRFSRDTEVVDNEMGNQMRLLSYILSMVIGTLIMCIIYLPWFAISVPFLAFAFISISSFYQASSREIKRLESVQRSYVYSGIGELLNGRHTLKIYNVEDLFLTKLSKAINNMNEAYFLTITNQRWLAVQLTVISTIFALIISFLCVFSVFNIGASSVGLLLSYVIQISNQLNTLMRAITQLENQMNSVERLNEYAMELIQENPYKIAPNEPRTDWPENGAIEFSNVSMTYRTGLPMVLKDVNVNIKPREKIGICGRTGAGKSSIMVTLFRLVELAKGTIYIDGIDISKIGLQDLRIKLSIIPQDPVLFKGDIRRNLDPFGQSSDDKLLKALKEVNLLDDVDSANSLSKFDLDYKVEDEGTNYSLGEKQLLSFARALVRNNKILILDEATSLVDYETDLIIQKTIAEAFSQCTILCIAHRLNTILNYDRIMVLDKGTVIEFDTPWNLYCNENGVFRDMCTKGNIGTSSFTRKD